MYIYRQIIILYFIIIYYLFIYILYNISFEMFDCINCTVVLIHYRVHLICTLFYSIRPCVELWPPDRILYRIIKVNCIREQFVCFVTISVDFAPVILCGAIYLKFCSFLEISWKIALGRVLFSIFPLGLRCTLFSEGRRRGPWASQFHFHVNLI